GADHTLLSFYTTAVFTTDHASTPIVSVLIWSVFETGTSANRRSNMKKKGYSKIDFTKLREEDLPESHTINGKKMPPDGTAQPEYKESALGYKMMKSYAIGNAQVAGKDFGPYVDYLGNGLYHRFELLFDWPEIPYSTGGVHPHTGLLLFSLALNMQADVIIETGTFFGYSTMFLAKACEVWGKGMVHTFDPDKEGILPDYVKDHPYIAAHRARSTDPEFEETLKRVEQVDFAFCDSWKRLSFYELQLIDRYLVEGGIIAFHDTQLFNSGKTFYEVVQKYFPLYDKMFFSGTPSEGDCHSYHGNADDRGLLVLRKRNEDPFLNVRDAGTDSYGAHQVMPGTTYYPIEVKPEGEE
ncbi:MAG: class I SAM-dependent methyltransferase, partial [Gammaproteobacteria bacterium]|nr:class I SAM-dependent methyltransferase [Gammaproteobacteria bacterium]